MLDEGGAGDLDALQFEDKLRSLGATFNASAGHESINVSLMVLKRNLDPAAALMADAIERPRFESKEWDRVKRLHLEDLKREEDEPPIVASHVAARAFFGDANPYGWPVSGMADTVSKLSVDDVRRLHASIFRPDFATILVAGDLAPAEAQSVLEQQFGRWRGEATAGSPRPKPETPAHEGLRVVIVDRPDAVQTVVQFIMPGPKFTDERRVSFRLLNTLFGGSFTSRINQNLREAHGYTYGARSRFVMEPSLGYFTASSSVRADVTGAALEEFLKEINRIRAGDISDEETGKARETLRTDVIQAFAGLNGLLGMAAELAVNNLPFETLARDMAAMQKVESKDLNALARPAIPLENGVLVLVGDKRRILEQLQKLDLPKPAEVNVRGEPTGS
jgi:predicted Zn-dependent peptidase